MVPETKIENAGSLKEGGHVVIENEPCKIIEVAHSKPGKHGAAKVRIVAIGLFDNKKRDIVLSASHPIPVPIILKKTGQVLSLTEKMATIMDLETYETFDIEIPEDIEHKPTVGCQVVYWEIFGKKILKQVKI